jgi:TldD protein
VSGLEVIVYPGSEQERSTAIPWLLLRTVAICLVLATGIGATGSPRERAPEKNNALLATMQQELRRAQQNLGKLDPAPYFLSYSVYDDTLTLAVGSQGTLFTSSRLHKRSAGVVVRVGTPTLDNTHGENRTSAISSGTLPLADDSDATAREFWRLTYEEYRKASRAYLNIKTKTQVNAQEEDTSADFSQETPQSHEDSTRAEDTPEQAALESLVRRYSAYLRKYPEIYSSTAIATAQRSVRYFVSSEGSVIATPNTEVRLFIEGSTRADDGMDLIRVETFQAGTLDHLPHDAEIASRVEKLAADLKALRSAPLAEPYDGPALLSGRAAAVYFHEVLGHRLEGHRQRGEKEGQTFTKKVNQPVLPPFLSVVDDPTLATLNGTELAGWYQYDDEGMPAARTVLIQDGVLKSFLMSRMPIKDFTKSNGHGRAQSGLMPTGRQGNLIVSSTQSVKDADLRQKLIDEVKKQNKPYGLYFEDIQGGFTLTERRMPQSFEVLPVLVWKVYPDGRPDELVRGVDIVGTPLGALSRIMLTGDKVAVFNGVCGAESGSVPVSAAAPAMLFSEIEVQKRAHSLARPPILPPPGFEGTPAAQTTKTGARK